MDELKNQSNPSERTIELSRHQWFMLRLVVAILFGGTIVFFSLRAGYDAAKYQSGSPWMSQGQTVGELKILTLAIAEYQQDHGILPSSLSQLQQKPAIAGVSVQDGWGRPFVYTVHGADYTLVSYGQDGKPGGSGWDKDLTWSSRTGNFHSVYSQPSFRQYLTAPVTRASIETAIVSGVLAAILCFVSIKPRSLTRWSIVGLIAKVGVVLLAAVAVGEFMTILHLPAGH